MNTYRKLIGHRLSEANQLAFISNLDPSSTCFLVSTSPPHSLAYAKEKAH